MFDFLIDFPNPQNTAVCDTHWSLTLCAQKGHELCTAFQFFSPVLLRIRSADLSSYNGSFTAFNMFKRADGDTHMFLSHAYVCLQIGLEEGAELLTGGARPPHMPKGYFLQPTVGDQMQDIMSSSC